MRAVSPETEGTAFFMGWMGEAADTVVQACRYVSTNLQIRIYKLADT